MSANPPPSPQERFTQLQSRAKTAYASADLSDVHRLLTEQAARPTALAKELARARERGYRFAAHLESAVGALDAQWQETGVAVRALIDEETARLGEIRRKIENIIDSGYRHKDGGTGLENIVSMLDGQVAALEAGVKEAEKRITPRFRDFQNAAGDAESALRTIHAHLDLLDDASFTLEGGETLYIAAPAEWVATGKSDKDPDGVLFLTSARLIFEQKETTGKKLGMFGGQKVHEVKWTVSLDQVQAVTAENKGLFGGRDMITLTLGGGAPHARLTLEVKGGVKSQYWAEQIEGLARGTIAPASPAQLAAASAAVAAAGGAAKTADAAVSRIETVVSVPKQCVNCGSPLGSAEAGAKEIVCRFCGTAHAILTRRAYPPITRANLSQLREIGGFGEAGSEHALSAMLNEISLSHDGSRLLTRGFAELAVWEVEAGTPLFRQPVISLRAALSPDGAHVATLTELQQTIDLLDATTGVKRHTLTPDARMFTPTLTFSPDGRWLAVATFFPSQVLIYSVPDWSLAYTLPMTLFVSGMAFSSDSRLIAVSCSQEVNPMRSEYKYETRIIALPGGEEKALLEVGGEYVSLPPDGGQVIVNSHLYSLADGRQIGDQIGMFHVRFSADAGMVVSAIQARVLWIDIQSRQGLAQIVGLEPYVSAWALSGDGGLLAVSSGGSLPGARSANSLPHRGVRLYAAG
jgi:hypothetical protein